jgi:hypothetical protein
MSDSANSAAWYEVAKNYLVVPVVYNIQILPDLLLAGTALLAILLANPAVVSLAVGAAAAQGLTRFVAYLLMMLQPNAAVVRSSLDVCTGGFIGKSWDRLFQLGTDHLWHPLAPSVYLATLGFFIGYGSALQQLYKEEVAAGMLPQRTLSGLLVTAAILSLAAVVFRYASGCESLLSCIAGLLFGFAFGYFGAIILGYATDRRATNLWGTPLLRDRINSGAPVYVCPENASNE